ncbi:protein tyrosine phosphatase [Sinomonas halotolerans]|uniref:Protein tyrosine phosphatase n=1 Tax=Sinomonas halotolerans TaxID=1644133 RepID=A0ABU9X0A3_9MICC
MSLFTVLASSKIAASAAALGALTVGGVGTAAYTGSLPAPAQEMAHSLIGAPAPAVAEAQAEGESRAQAAQASAEELAADAQAKGTSQLDAAKGEAEQALADARELASKAVGNGSDPANLDVLGLCTAHANGGLDADSTAYRSLSVSAEGEANIAAYCADVTAEAAAQGAASATGSVEAPDAPAVPAVPAEDALPSAPAPSLPAVPTEAPSGLAEGVR